MKSHHAMDELNEFLLMGKIDPSHEFHIDTPHVCTPKVDSTVANELKQCTNVDAKDVATNQDKYKLLVLENGGLNLKQFSKKGLKEHLNSGNTRHKLDLFWKEFHNLIKGVAHMYSNGLVHNDIKPQNVLYDSSTGRMKFIDFGLMRSINEVKKSSEESYNFLGVFHWSYPFDCGFMNKDKFNAYKKMSAGERRKFRNNFALAIIKAKQTDHTVTKQINSFSLNNPDSFKIVFSYLTPDLLVPDMKIQLGLIISFFDGFDKCIESMTYDEYLKKTIQAIDIFGLGITMQYFINAVNTVYPNFSTEERMKLTFFCNKMYDFYSPLRVTDAEQLLQDYEYVLYSLGVTDRLKLNTKESSLKLLNNVKQVSHSPKLSAALTEYANQDPVTVGHKAKPLRPCKPDQVRNTRTNRCISKKAVKRNYTRALKPCSEGKTRNQFTNRCVYTSSFKRFQRKHNRQKPCKEGKERNPKTGRCRTVRLAKPCKEGKERNPKTGRCRTVRNKTT